MYRRLALTFCLILLPAVMTLAQEKMPAPPDSEPKELSGMSIVGNDEAPKALYIVPWKSSEIGVETSLNRLLTEEDVPVDRDVFLRQLDFYTVSTAQPGNWKPPAGRVESPLDSSPGPDFSQILPLVREINSDI